MLCLAVPFTHVEVRSNVRLSDDVRPDECAPVVNVIRFFCPVLLTRWSFRVETIIGSVVILP